MIKKLITISGGLSLFGIIESVLAVQNMELYDFCTTTSLIALVFLIVMVLMEFELW